MGIRERIQYLCPFIHVKLGFADDIFPLPTTTRKCLKVGLILALFRSAL